MKRHSVVDVVPVYIHRRVLPAAWDQSIGVDVHVTLVSSDLNHRRDSVASAFINAARLAALSALNHRRDSVAPVYINAARLAALSALNQNHRRIVTAPAYNNAARLSAPTTLNHRQDAVAAANVNTAAGLLSSGLNHLRNVVALPLSYALNHRRNVATPALIKATFFSTAGERHRISYTTSTRTTQQTHQGFNQCV